MAQQVPADLLAKALEHAKEHMPNPEETIKQLQAGNIDTLYNTAKSLNEKDDRITSVQIWHSLADGDAKHILSMVALGFSYSQVDKENAIKYFVMAGEDGPHQAALYNAGRLFVEAGDFLKGLAYFRAAATLVETSPSHAKPKMTATSKEAYETISKQIMMMENLPLQEMANMFLYASISDVPKVGSSAEEQWNRAMQALQEYAQSKNKVQLQSSQTHLAKLQEDSDLSDLQQHLIRIIMARTRKLMDES